MKDEPARHPIAMSSLNQIAARDRRPLGRSQSEEAVHDPFHVAHSDGLGRRLTERFLDSQIGTTHVALTLEDGSLAVTGNYVKVRIAPGRMRNEWVCLTITSHHDGELLSR